MKKSFVIVSALAIAGASSWAQTNAFPVKLRGLVSFPASPVAVTKLGVTEANLLSSPANHLVLVIDLTNHDLRVQEVDSGTNIVINPALMRARRFAILPDRSFSAGMRFNFDLPPLFGGVGVDGDLQITGKFALGNGVPTKVTAGVIGVLNDFVAGVNTNGDIVLKGKLTPAGKPFDGGPFGL